MLKAKHVMTTQVVVAYSDDSIDGVIDQLLRHRVSGLPVVDQENNLVGVISEYDLLQAVYDDEIAEGRVVDYMSHRTISVNTNDSVLDVADLLLHNPARRLPVVEDGKLAGVISRHDLIRVIRETRRRVADIMPSHSQADKVTVS